MVRLHLSIHLGKRGVDVGRIAPTQTGDNLHLPSYFQLPKSSSNQWDSVIVACMVPAE